MLIWTSNKARKFPLFDLSLALLSSLCTLEAMDCFLQMNALYNTFNYFPVSRYGVPLFTFDLCLNVFLVFRHVTDGLGIFYLSGLSMAG